MLFRIYALIVMTAGAAGLTLLRPFWGFLLFIFLSFTHPEHDRPNMAALAIPQVIASVTIFSLIIQGGAKQLISAFKRKETIVLSLFFATLFISGMFATSPLMSWVRIKDFAVVYVTFLLTLTFLRTEKDIRTFTWLILLIGAYFVYLSLTRGSYPTYLAEEQAYQRLVLKMNRSFGNPNYLGITVGLVFLLSLALFQWRGKAYLKPLYLGIGTACLVIVLKTQSRGAVLATAGGLIYLMAISKRRLMFFAGAAVAALAFLMWAPETLTMRLQTIADYEQDRNAMGRMEINKIALEQISENPVLGVGPENLVLYAPNTPHNAFIQIASEVGLPGLIFWSYLFFSGWIMAFKSRRALKRSQQDGDFLYYTVMGLEACFAALAVMSMTTGFAYREFVFVMIAFSCSAAYLIQAKVGERAWAPAAACQKEVPVGAERLSPLPILSWDKGLPERGEK